MGILVILVSLLMVLGGLLPNMGNGALHAQLDKILNHPEKLVVQLHPDAPSVSLLGGQIAYIEVEAQRFTLMGLPIERLQLHVDRVGLDREKLDQGQLNLNSPAQAVLRLQITEAGLNQFAQTEKMQQIIAKLKQSQADLPVEAEVTDISFDLQEDQVTVRATAQTFGGFFTIPLELRGRFRLQSESQLFLYQADAVQADLPVSSEMLTALLQQINPVLDLAKFNTPDLQMFMREFSIRGDSLYLVGEVRLKSAQLPAGL